MKALRRPGQLPKRLARETKERQRSRERVAEYVNAPAIKACFATPSESGFMDLVIAGCLHVKPIFIETPFVIAEGGFKGRPCRQPACHRHEAHPRNLQDFVA
jgi:hypothetical protein